jgi:hypothetical protein
VAVVPHAGKPNDTGTYQLPRLDPSRRIANADSGSDQDPRILITAAWFASRPAVQGLRRRYELRRFLGHGRRVLIAIDRRFHGHPIGGSTQAGGPLESISRVQFGHTTRRPTAERLTVEWVSRPGR